MHHGPLQLVERQTGRVVVPRLEVADGFWHRFLGWQFRRLPPLGHGLLLVPCQSIHTCWMRFAIDVAAVDRAGRVLEVRRAVRPWRAALLPLATHAVLEMPTGTLGIEPGEQLLTINYGGAVPRAAQFLAPQPSDEI